MKKLSSKFLLRVSFLLAGVACWFFLQDPGSTFSSHDRGPDPDERFVLETGQPVGELSFEVLEDLTGVHLPSRLYFAHADGRPETPVVGRFENFLVTASGRELKTIPVGRYHVYVSRGFEYTLDRQEVEILEGKRSHFTSTLSRAIDTSGFISSDFHLHLQFAMRDGAIVSAAAGLDLLTATDHNILKDYSPYIEELNLGRFMSSVVGAEIDTAFGHYNSFPMSLNRWQDRSYRYSIRTPGEFLRLMVQNPGDEIVQINHPRYNAARGGYYNTRLNRETGEIEYPFFETGFDQVEVYNALTVMEDRENPHFGRNHKLDQNLRDWYSLLNRGIAITGVGNTDAHRYPSELPGYPRNYVLSDTDNPWEIDPYKVVDALKRGASSASLGPFIRFTIDDGVQMGSTHTARDGSVMLHVNVQRAPWIPLDRVEIVANGKVLRTLSTLEAEEGTRHHWDIEVKADQDTWILVLATSDRRWETPFSHFSSFAFTNPIWVDFDGNGYFDPPNPGYPANETAE